MSNIQEVSIMNRRFARKLALVPIAVVAVILTVVTLVVAWHADSTCVTRGWVVTNPSATDSGGWNTGLASMEFSALVDGHWASVSTVSGINPSDEVLAPAEATRVVVSWDNLPEGETPLTYYRPEGCVAETTVPTTNPPTTVGETTVPETTLPETTAPDTTIPATIPETTTPATSTSVVLVSTSVAQTTTTQATTTSSSTTTTVGTTTTNPSTTTTSVVPKRKLPKTGADLSLWLKAIAVALGTGAAFILIARRPQRR